MRDSGSGMLVSQRGSGTNIGPNSGVIQIVAFSGKWLDSFSAI
jgi:hypothetical protein